jgi:hypothetical protein
MSPAALSPSVAPLHQTEGRRAVRPYGAKLTVEIGAIDMEPVQRFGGRRVLAGPVEPRARGDQLDLPTIDAGVHAVAIEFQLMRPALAFRGFGDELRQLRPDEGRQRRIEDAGLPRIAFLPRWRGSRPHRRPRGRICGSAVVDGVAWPCRPLHHGKIKIELSTRVAETASKPPGTSTAASRCPSSRKEIQ